MGAVPAESYPGGKELQVNRLAARQHRVVQGRQLNAIGISNRAITARVKAGRLFRRHRGVYGIPPAPLTPHGECLAAVMAIGPDAVLDDMSAGFIHGFWKRLTWPIHVAVPREVRSRPEIRVHVRHELSTTRKNGIPIVTPAFALRSMADTLRSDKALRRAVHEAQVQRLVVLPQLHAQIAARPGPGAARLARLITHGPLPTRSGDEDEVVAMLIRGGLPVPVTNARIPGLPTWIEVDIWYAEFRVAIEVDSAFHDTDIRRQDDAAKQRIIEAHGIRLIRLRKEDALDHERETVAYVRRALFASAA